MIYVIILLMYGVGWTLSYFLYKHIFLMGKMGWTKVDALHTIPICLLSWLGLFGLALAYFILKD